MYITKEILNDKQRKIMEPHKKQILKQIKASIHDEDWLINRQSSIVDHNQIKPKRARPQTAHHVNSNPLIRHSSIDRFSIQQHPQRRSNSFMKKINYQFKEIKEISSFFDKFFQIKKKKVPKQKFNFPQKVLKIKEKIQERQKEQIISFQTMKREHQKQFKQNQVNQYIGYPKEKVGKVIPVGRAKNQDANVVARCIKGGYFSEAEEFSDVVNKAEIVKLKKRFITMSTLYDNVKGKKNKRISQMKPQDVENSSFKNLVYYLENEKHLKVADKMTIQKKINLIS